MKQKYKELMAVINIEVQQVQRLAADRYYRTAMILKIIAIFSIVLAMLSILFSFRQDSIDLAVLVMVILYAWYRKMSSAKIQNILLKDCDPEKMLSFHLALTAHSNRNRNWDLYFYNICSDLYYAGRFEEVKKVQALFQKYCTNNSNHFKYELICVTLAWHEKDMDSLLIHCNHLDKLVKAVHPAGIFHFLYEEAMRYPVLLQMENDKEYQKAYDMIEQGTFAYCGSVLSEVKRNYYMYETAMAMGDKQTAGQHADFIIKNGGTLWYRQQLLMNFDRNAESI